jgi:uncharacterized DUF497 family protein
MDLEWDVAKAEANLRKHGVSFHEAATVLGDPLSRVIDDPIHSQGEDRYIVMGTSSLGRLLLVSITDRASRVRIISARQMTPRERRAYEQSL